MGAIKFTTNLKDDKNELNLPLNPEAFPYKPLLVELTAAAADVVSTKMWLFVSFTEETFINYSAF